MLYLKSNSQIAAVIADVAYASILTDRRASLAANFQALPAASLQASVDVLLPVVPAVEANFISALFTSAPVVFSGVPSIPATTGPGYSSAITSVGDGATGSLERVATTGLADHTWREFYRPSSDEVQGWLLYPDDEVPAQGEKQIPLDHAVGTNARTWVRKR